MSKGVVYMEIILGVCDDFEITEERNLLNYMFINKEIFSDKERLMQSQKLDEIMNQKKMTIVSRGTR